MPCIRTCELEVDIFFLHWDMINQIFFPMVTQVPSKAEMNSMNIHYSPVEKFHICLLFLNWQLRPGKHMKMKTVI